MPVSYLERGDPSGAPVLHFHGWPSSRLEQFAGEDLLLKHHLRWLSLDRPGYGETPFQREHTLRNWARTIDRWATDHGLDRFHVCGFSGGGPFAQAVAAHLPERVLSLHLIASLAPFGDGAVQVPPPWAGAGEVLLKYAPALAVLGFAAFNRYRKLRPLAAERFQLSTMHPSDREILDHPHILDRFAKSHEASMQQGVRHIIEDLQLYRSRWDFEQRIIQCPTRIWVGSEDIQVPAECSRWLAKQIPNATLREYPGEAHYLAYRHADEILAAIG